MIWYFLHIPYLLLYCSFSLNGQFFLGDVSFENRRRFLFVSDGRRPYKRKKGKDKNAKTPKAESTRKPEG